MKKLILSFITLFFTVSSFANGAFLLMQQRANKERANAESSSNSFTSSGANRFFICHAPWHIVGESKVNIYDRMSDGFCPMVCNPKNHNQLLEQNGFPCQSDVKMKNGDSVIFVPVEKLPKVFNPKAEFKGIAYNQYNYNLTIYYWLEH